MNNQVLALKYRPKKFDDLIGQSTISTTLSLALDTQRLSHAYLFSGLRGSGKTSTARIMAKALVCVNAPTSKPCDICDACMSANENRHLDIIEMDAASNRGIDDIKDLIEHTKYKPTSAKFKVFIIDEVHMLTTQAFNALLKTLEEPPDFVKFILATTDPLKLPATILSRTQHFRFKKIAHKDVHHHLTHILNLENVSYESEALDILIRSGQGSLRDTLTLLDQAIIFSKGTITTVSVTDMMGMIDPQFMSKVFDVVLNKQDINDIYNSLESYEIGQVIDEMSIYLKYAMLGKDSRFDIFMFDRFFRILSEAKQLLSINSDGGFVLILTLNKLIEATSFKTIDTMINEVQQDIKVEQTNTPQAPMTQQQEVVQVQTTQTPTPQEINTPIVQSRPEIQQQNIPQEQAVQIQTAKVEQVQITEEPTTAPVDKNIELYDQVIAKVNDRSATLGECFENSFKYSSYENSSLTIDSTAQGDCKTLLFKHFAHIRMIIEDIFGNDTKINFNKVEPIKKDLP